MNGERYARISGWGKYVPERVLTNAELAQTVETTDEWICSRTGIRERRIAAGERETTAGMATRAARDALRVASLSPNQLDLVIVATVTPEYAFPSTASLVQDALGAARAGAFDLSAGCSGFIYALSVARSCVQAGAADHVLVIGSETLSKVTDWSDRNTCVLFGDGAGAVVVSACQAPCGVMAAVLGSDGSGGDLLMIPAGGSHQPASLDTVSNGGHYIHMHGREVFRFATQIIAKAAGEVVESAGWKVEDVSLVVPHQANVRIIESAAKRMNLPADKFFVNLDRYGNTSSASIPIALCEAIERGQVRAGDRLVLVGFGAGLTWGAAAIEWGTPMPMPVQRWPRRALTSVYYAWAAVRSTGLRAGRRIYNFVLGPEGREDLRGQLRRQLDTWRRRKTDDGRRTKDE